MPGHPPTPVRLLGAVGPEGTRVVTDHGSAYRDGAEDALLELLTQAKDLSSLSDELAGAAEGWAQTYHLSPSRANVLRGLSLPRSTRVLEVGAGCGAVTRWLGETCDVVDALEPVPSRAAVARARTRDLPGVEVVVGQLEDVPAEPTYDLVVVVGVLEYVGGGTADPAPYEEFLAAVAARLVPGGTLLLAIENKLGVKYLAGAPEDHTDVVFDSLEDYPGGAHARTFSRRELTALVESAGLEPEVHLAFPDYKLPRVVMRGDLAPVRDLAHRLPRFPSPDWLSPRPRLADEHRLWRTLVQAGVARDFGNSFVVLARRGPGPDLWPAHVLASFWATDRRAAYATQTDVVVRAGGHAVSRRLLRPTEDEQGVRARASDEPLVAGEDLLDVVARCPVPERQAHLARWAATVRAASTDGGAPVDLVPHNVVVAPDGALVAVDDEWRSDDHDLDDVLARGALWLAARVSAQTVPTRWAPATTVAELVGVLAAELGLQVDDAWWSRLLALESRLQATVLPPRAGEDADAHVARRRHDLEVLVGRALEELPLGLRETDHLERARGRLEELSAREAATSEALADRTAALAAAEEHAAALAADLDEQRSTLSRQADHLHEAHRAAELARELSAVLDREAEALRRDASEARTAARASERSASDHARLLHEVRSGLAQRLVSSYRLGVERRLPAGSRRRSAYARVLRHPQHAVAHVDAPPPVQLALSAAPEVTVVVPVHGQWEVTRRCLASLAEHDAGVPVEVVVVDDASLDDTAAQLQRCRGVRVVSLARNVGFVGACNAGIAVARGHHVVLLNNDTEVTAGWLTALLETARQPGVGLVGARLVYPDGTLQEAGGLVFSDGTAWNVGRAQSPDDPRYAVPRDVDYCSGAALMVRADLLHELGGLDPRYSPAYYEDTDLAFAVRARGLRVVYEPRSVVVHHEGLSNGTDTAAATGLKRYQEVNRLRFADKWREELRHQPPPGEVRAHAALPAGELGVVLVVDHYTPEPDQDSGSLRMASLLHVLRAMGWGVLFVPDNRARTEPYTEELQRAGIEVLHGHGDLPQRLRELGPRLRMAVLSRPSIAWRYVGMLREVVPDCPVVYDTVDLHYVREGRRAELLGDPALTRVADVHRELELGLVRTCDATLVVSPLEQRELAAQVPGARVVVVPNVHEVRPAEHVPPARPGLLFVGSFAHTPNTDAVHWFVDEVWPTVLAARPDAVFRVVGSRAEPVAAALAGRAGVEVLGWVSDLAPVYAQTSVSVAPLRYGAGVKGKVGDAVAHGVPVVGTTVAVEGMHLRHGHDVLVGDTADELAAHVLRLLDEPELAAQLVTRARTTVDRAFGPAAARAALQELIDTVVVRS